MSDGDALLQAVIENHDDDTPRLVYADWVEEHGESEADRARAEFIRVQVELTRLAEDDARRHPLQLRETELLGWYEEDWLAPLDRWRVHRPDWPRTVWRRGFAEGIEVHGDAFVNRTAELFALAPLRRVSIFILPDSASARLAAQPLLLRLRGLHLWSPEGGRGLEDLLISPHLANLTSLQFPGLASPFLEPEERNNVLTPRGVELLSDESHLTQLEELDLTAHSLGDEGVEILAGSLVFRRLTRLVLRENWLTDRAARALAESATLGRLKEIDVRSNRIGPEGERVLRARFGDGALVSDPRWFEPVAPGDDEIPF